MEEKTRFLQRIEALEVQGATAVAAETLRFAVEHLPKEDAALFVDELRRAVLDIRPTEPMLDNVTDIAVTQIEEGRDPGDVLHNLLDYVEDVNNRIVEECVNKLFNGERGAVLTHCHSSTAESLIIAGSERSDIETYVTETRPRYQGRTTARNLVNNGVETTLIVDSAVFSILDEVDLVLVGADALTDTQVYNKIGTSQIAYIAKKKDISFVVAASLLKYTAENPVIEQRTEDEVWEDRPKNLDVLNPAFDAAPLAHVTKLCTEHGMIEPGDVAETAEAVRNTV